MHSPKLESLLHGRENNFNLIRFISAWGVLFAHSYLLVSNRPVLSDPIDALFGVGMGTFFVTIFFAISGFLIYRSLLRSQDLSRYFVARMKRILPALAVVLIITTFGLGTVVSQLDPLTYLTHPHTWSYLFNINVLNLHTQFELPGVFEHTPYPRSVNGSIWTLPIEVWMYVIVAACYCFGVMMPAFIRRIRGLLIPASATAMGGLLCYFYAYFKANPNADSQTMTLFACVFLCGALCYHYRAHLPLSRSWAAASAVGLLLCKGTFIYPLYYALCISYCTLVLAYRPSGKIRYFNRLGDYSYGLYIYAFPVQQTLVFYFPNIRFETLLCSATLISLSCAIASWHLIEAPVLRTK